MGIEGKRKREGREEKGGDGEEREEGRGGEERGRQPAHRVLASTRTRKKFASLFFALCASRHFGIDVI